ncbi:hypothetical protein GGX14DRAFT_600559 [Mycena pura]|uniref:DUF6534 domain-containing protein n=1 Tax=Mycena pura TaxID=153505 RepID=A0AAD6UQA3_9AGAR|nr:hypothetical protein GGX14DRAFT_600559 [Mycena pura]
MSSSHLPRILTDIRDAQVALLLTVVTVAVVQWWAPKHAINAHGSLTAGVRTYTVHIWQSRLLRMISIHRSSYVASWTVRKNVLACGAIGATSVAALSLGIVMIISMMSEPTFAHWSAPHMKVTITLVHTLTFIAALLICGAMAAHSRPETRAHIPSAKRHRLTPVQHVLKHLIPYGGLGAGIQLACLVTFVARPRTILWLPFYLISTKLFVNGLLYMINSREILQRHQDSTPATGTGTGTVASTTGSTYRTVAPGHARVPVINISSAVHVKVGGHGHDSEAMFEKSATLGARNHDQGDSSDEFGDRHALHCAGYPVAQELAGWLVAIDTTTVSACRRTLLRLER